MQSSGTPETLLERQPVYPLLDPEACRRAGRTAAEVLGLWRARGLNVFQLRAKNLAPEAYVDLAAGLLREFPGLRILANDHAEVALGRRDLFQGLHIGQEDWQDLGDSLRSRLRQVARDNLELAPEDVFVLGFSTHDSNQLSAALASWKSLGQDGPSTAGDSGPPLWSYVAIGPLGSTRSKQAGLSPVLSDSERRTCFAAFADLVREVLAGFRNSRYCPFLVAIGGIDAENVDRLFSDWNPWLPRRGPLPAVIQAGADPVLLDCLIKKVALQERDKTLET